MAYLKPIKNRLHYCGATSCPESTILQSVLFLPTQDAIEDGLAQGLNSARFSILPGLGNCLPFYLYLSTMIFFMCGSELSKILLQILYVCMYILRSWAIQKQRGDYCPRCSFKTGKTKFHIS